MKDNKRSILDREKIIMFMGKKKIWYERRGYYKRMEPVVVKDRLRVRILGAFIKIFFITMICHFLMLTLNRSVVRLKLIILTFLSMT